MDTNSDLDNWFRHEILPLDPVVMRFLRKNWRDASEIDDLRQEAYTRVYSAALQTRRPVARTFLCQTIYDLLEERLRENKEVVIGSLMDLEKLSCISEEASPERVVAAREEVVRLQEVLDDLPERCRMAVLLRKVHCLSLREIALRMGVSESTVEQHLTKGTHILAQAVADRRGKTVSQAKRYLGRRTSQNPE